MTVYLDNGLLTMAINLIYRGFKTLTPANQAQ